MSAPTLYTEREKVLAMREAAARSRCSAFYSATDSDTHRWFEHGEACDACASKAASRYPLPKIIRPRLVCESDGMQWRAVDGVLQFRRGDNWISHEALTERVKFLAELLARPTEESDDE